MRRNRFTCLCLLALLLLSACASPPPTPQEAQTASLFVFRSESPAFVEYSPDLRPLREIPFSFPVYCGLYDAFPAPAGGTLAVELTCPNGPSVLFLDLGSGAITLPVTEVDSHFLAWTADSAAVYLKVDSLGTPRVVRARLKGGQEQLPIPEFAYDLAVNPANEDFIFALSRGLGYGSELNLTQSAVRTVKQLYADPANYISFARFSPDGGQVAFIKIPDTQTPFTVGELWVMDADGANARKLADADAGHGYAANWSPDGARIAFVVRENPQDETADQSSEALLSNIYIAAVEGGALTRVTALSEGRVETPRWSPDGNTLAFNGVINGRMTVFIVDVAESLSGDVQPLVIESACCPAWMRK